MLRLAVVVGWIDGRSILEVTRRRRRRHENSWEIVLSDFPWHIHTEKCLLTTRLYYTRAFAILSSLLNSWRLDRRLDNDLITSARRADVSLPARPTHACTCNCNFPGNQGRGQPVWSWAAATPFPP